MVMAEGSACGFATCTWLGGLAGLGCTTGFATAGTGAGSAGRAASSASAVLGSTPFAEAPGAGAGLGGAGTGTGAVVGGAAAGGAAVVGAGVAGGATTATAGAVAAAAEGTAPAGGCAPVATSGTSLIHGGSGGCSGAAAAGGAPGWAAAPTVAEAPGAAQPAAGGTGAWRGTMRSSNAQGGKGDTAAPCWKGASRAHVGKASGGGRPRQAAAASSCIEFSFLELPTKQPQQNGTIHTTASTATPAAAAQPPRPGVNATGDRGGGYCCHCTAP